MDWIKCIASRLLRAVRREVGVTLIETVIAISIFGIASTSLIAVLTSATAADGLSRQRSIALELAQQEVEYVRQLSYSNVGIVGGNPPGVIVATQQKVVAGLTYTLTTRIRWVNDPIASSFVTYANYKQVRVTITRKSDNKQLARVYTYLSSSTRAPYGGVNNAIINVNTQDYALKTALQNVAVSLYDGPENTNDVTDETGLVTFPALTPNPTSGNTSYYDISAYLSASYQTLREDIGPASPSPTLGATAAHIQVAPSQTVTTTIYLYQPVTFCIQILNSDGSAYSNSATVDIGQNLSSSSSLLRSADEFSLSTPAPGSCPSYGGNPSYLIVTGNTALIDDLGSEPLIPGVAYEVGVRTPVGCTTSCSYAEAHAQLGQSDGYPNTLSKTFSVTLPSSPTATISCKVTVKNGSGSTVQNARVDVSNWASSPNIYFTGTTNSSGAYTFSVPPQSSGYNVYARSGPLNTLNGTPLVNKGWTTASSCSSLGVVVK